MTPIPAGSGAPSTNKLLILGIVAAATVVVWWWLSNKKKPDRSPAVLEQDISKSETAVNSYLMDTPLKDALLAAVDRTVPVSMVAAKIPAEYTDEEATGVCKYVLHRVNRQVEPLPPRLHLINVDSVLKTSDVYKVVFFDVAFNVHDAATRTGIKLFASVIIVPSGKTYIRELRPYDKELSSMVDSETAVQKTEYAPYTPT